MSQVNGYSYNSCGTCRENRCGCTSEPVVSERELMALRFSAHEAGLYLTTHPCDAEALNHFRCTQAAYEAALSAYERTHGAITRESGSCPDWNWVESPWPWE